MKLAMEGTFRFAAPGTLERPGPIGRLGRLAMGILMGWVAWQTALNSDVADLSSVALWFWFLFALLLAPYVVNIGFGVKSGAWPRIVAIVLVTGGGLVDYVQGGTFMNGILWATMAVVMVYLFGHLGLSFLLSALLATPGCEMRAISHLVGIVRGKPSQEHYCPGYIDGLDRWERERAKPKEQRSVPDGPANDLTRGWGRLLLVYGIPWLAIQLVGNLSDTALPVAVTWTLAFTVMGVACVVNAVRCNRVHCWFVGPWFLLTALTTALRYFDFVSLSWPTIVNAGLLGALLLFLFSENIWGKYFGETKA